MSKIHVPSGGLLNWGNRQGKAPAKRSSIATGNSKYMYGKKGRKAFVCRHGHRHCVSCGHLDSSSLFQFNGESWVLMHEQVIVTPDNPETTMKSGIIIPGTVMQEEWYFTMGTVWAVGERVTEDIRVGDRILYDGFVALPLEDDPFSRKEVVWQKYIWMVLRDE